MSVYTHLSLPDAQAVADAYQLGEIKSLEPIKAGVSNTNYFLTADACWVLTVFEDLDHQAVEPVLLLQQQMYEQLMPVPQIARNRFGQLYQFDGKPLTVVARLSGHHGEQTCEHAVEIGRFLARLHNLSLEAPLPNNLLSVDWVHEETALLNEPVLKACCQYIQATDLARGIVHADLFPDNALFNANQLTGVIDWYFASVDYYLWDLAVAAVAWAEQDETIEDALLAAYEDIRPLSCRERDCWVAMKVVAAARFWLTRKAAEQDTDDELVTKKNSAQMYNLMQHYQAQWENN